MKLNQTHFKFFRNECEKQFKRLGLQSWKIYYKFGKLNDSFANVNWKYSGRVATITLATNFPLPFDNLEIQLKETALHECLEILLASISSMAEDRTWDRLDFDKEIHSIIRTLEKIL